MKLLLDTHTFLWWDSDPGRLSARALAACQDRSNTITLSMVSAWEIQVKSQLGKLRLSLPLAEIIAAQQRANQIALLPIVLPHVLDLQSLPPAHKDPFDRLLISQARTEAMVLVTSDSIFAEYPVELLW